MNIQTLYFLILLWAVLFESFIYKCFNEYKIYFYWQILQGAMNDFKQSD